MIYNKKLNVELNKQGIQGAQGEQGIQGPQGATGPQGVRGSLEFSGTEINAISDITEATYTITTASTGITSATMPILVGDTYINVTTQDVWICSTAGTPTTAKWMYQGRRCSDKDDSNRFRMFTPATDNGTMQITLTKSVVKGENPFGKIDDLLKITNTNGTSASNYTPYNRRIKIDPKKTYRYVAYVKQEDANYTDFFGVQGYRTYDRYIGELSTGTALNYAYFVNSTNFGTLGRWYMIVGYVVANGTTTAPADSGVYDMVTKQKVRTVTNFQWLSTATAIRQNGTLIRYTESASTKTGTAYLYDIRLDEINGTEPTLNELLNLDTTTKSKGTWTASTVYNTGDIVYLNGNSYICTANHTSGTSFSTTNWNLIASKGADGKNAITMTSTTTPNGEYNGQIGIWQGQVYQWDGTSWVLTSGILPTDPVLHYSFDELPDIPDGTNNFTGVIAGVSYTKEDIKGGYRFTLNGIDPYIHFRTNIGAVESLALCYRQKAISKTGGAYSNEAYIFYTDSSYSSISNFIPTPTESENIVRTTIPCDKTKTVAYIRLDMFAGEGHSAVIEVTDMYIGDASYTTPIIDNSGNRHNATDVKGLATKGVSGKALFWLKGQQPIRCQNVVKNKNTNFSFAVWVKATEIGNNGILGSRTGTWSNGWGLTDGAIFYLLKNQLQYNASVPIPKDNDFHLIIGVYDDTTMRSYLDGQKSSERTITLFEGEQAVSNIYLGAAYGGVGSSFDGSFDDFQIFDRPLSDQEVLGLYLARGNTPKRYTFADYQNSINGGKYHSTTKPTIAFEGDYYLNATDGYIYSYDGTAWVKITDYNDARYKMAMTDMINLAATNPNVPFISVTNAWIKNLAAGNILANEIATKELKLTGDGVIKSENYGKTTGGFEIKADGQATFANVETPIVLTSGNICFMRCMDISSYGSTSDETLSVEFETNAEGEFSVEVQLFDLGGSTTGTTFTGTLKIDETPTVIRNGLYSYKTTETRPTTKGTTHSVKFELTGKSRNFPVVMVVSLGEGNLSKTSWGYKQLVENVIVKTKTFCPDGSYSWNLFFTPSRISAKTNINVTESYVGTKGDEKNLVMPFFRYYPRNGTFPEFFATTPLCYGHGAISGLVKTSNVGNFGGYTVYLPVFWANKNKEDSIIIYRVSVLIEGEWSNRDLGTIFYL